MVDWRGAEKSRALTTPAARKPKWTPKGPLPPLAPGDVRLLAGGNPQIAKADGDAPVQASIAAMPGWKPPLGGQIDALILVMLPEVARAMAWNAPFWGGPGQGWIVSLACVARYVKVTFFRGTLLTPMPPVGSKVPQVRYLHVSEDQPLDAAVFADWLRQAARLGGAALFCG